jgi:tight adherence protein C
MDISFALSSSQFGLLIASLAGATVLLGSVGLYSFLNSRLALQAVRRKVEGSWEGEGAAGMPGNASSVAEGLFQSLTALGHWAKPRRAEELSRTRKRLVQAGYRAADALMIFLGLKILLTVVLPGLYVFLRSSSLSTLPVSYTMFFLIFTALLGYYTPDIGLRLLTRRRTRKIFEGFPDALDLMVVCVEAGLGLDAAIQRVGQELKLTHKVLHEEFALVNFGLQAGQTRQMALKNLSLRIDLEEVSNFVAMLIQTDKFGTSVAQALRVHADAMRLKRRQKAEELAMKIPVKLLFPLIFFIFPSLFVVILGPAGIQICRTLLPAMGGQ